MSRDALGDEALSRDALGDEALSRDALIDRSSALIERLAGGGRDDVARDQLLRQLLRWQRQAIPAYGRIVERLGSPSEDPLCWPAVPSDVFRFARVAAHPVTEDVRVFRSSGTTTQARVSHYIKDLSLYDRAARAAARHALFPDVERIALVILAQPSEEQPDSSLSYMLDRFCDWFGRGPSVCVLREGRLDLALLEHTLEHAERSQTPLALLGTSFAFVHAEDALSSRRYRLPTGSRIMQTGGFKGRSREIEPEAMLRLLALRYGIDPRLIMQEYGMTELSSQLYETTLRDAALDRAPGPRRLWLPGWVRATLVDPETLAEAREGQEGLLRIDDLANIDSACAIQTADRARRVDDGIVVLGRALGASARGCSLAVDAALGG
jgi:hypothetical protein